MTFCNNCCNLNFGYAAVCWLKFTWTRVVHLYAICVKDLQQINNQKNIQNKSNNNKWTIQQSADSERMYRTSFKFEFKFFTHTCASASPVATRPCGQLQRCFVWQQCLALERCGAKAKDCDFNAATCLSFLIHVVAAVVVVVVLFDYRRQLLNCICIFALSKYNFYLISLVVVVVTNLIQARLPFAAVMCQLVYKNTKLTMYSWLLSYLQVILSPLLLWLLLVLNFSLIKICIICPFR